MTQQKLDIPKRVPLYDVPRGTQIRLTEEKNVHPPAHREFEQNEILIFHHIDGMYSYCTDSKGKAVHLAAWTDVEIIGDEDGE